MMNLSCFPRAVTALFLVAIVLSGCKPTPPDESAKGLDATIRWTSYGIPHIKAADWGSLGYGFGYAIAEDAVCVLEDVMVTVNGERARYFGPGDGNLASDIFHRGMLDDAALAHYRKGQPADMERMGEGYIAGFNRYLRDHAGTLPASCNGKPWVREMSRDDAARIAIGVGIRYGLGNFMREIAGAAPPGAGTARLERMPELPDMTLLGSNAYAFGGDVTGSGRGILLGNPHYPWEGPSRFHLAHLTIPGELDVMGAGLYTTAIIAIGFNRDVAWSHTVSTALRFTLYELDLVPGSPLTYRYGEGTRELVARPLTIAIKGDDGTLRNEEHTVYLSHFGPVLTSEALPWTAEHAYVIRDSNLSNNRSTDQYYRMDRAGSVEELEKALEEAQGVSWVNTIAADRFGNALYADLSVVPNVSSELLDKCRVPGHESLGRLAGILLRGSDPGCEWREDPRAAAPGIMPPQELPKLFTRQYVTNSNDSYWLSNPDHPLEGYSPIIGDERVARTLRTRAGLVFVEEVLGQDRSGKFSAQTVQDILYSQRNFGAELLLDDIVEICSGVTAPVVLEGASIDVGDACNVLAAWDRKQTLASKGVQVYTEFWRNARTIANLFAVPFDAANAVHTPRGINKTDPGVRQEILQALARAVKTLAEKDVPAAAPWGEVQFVQRGDERIGIPGGDGNTGMFSVISAPLKQGGYTPVVSGNSYIQVVTWDEQGNPDVQAILTYSQSQEPDSAHYADLTRLYSSGGWLHLPFTEEQIAADEQKRIVLTESAR